MIIGKEFKFESSHCLKGHPKCGYMHGHTYKITVEVEGPIDPITGIVFDLNLLSLAVKEVIEAYDHRCLNDFILIPTCENLVEVIWETLKNNYALTLHSITIQEGDGGYATKRSEQLFR